MPNLFYAAERSDRDALMAAGWQSAIVAGVERWQREIAGGVWTLSFDEAVKEMRREQTVLGREV